MADVRASLPDVQRAQRHMGCEMSVMIIKETHPLTGTAPLFALASAGHGHVCVAHRGRTVYEVVEYAFARNGADVHRHHLIDPVW